MTRARVAFIGIFVVLALAVYPLPGTSQQRAQQGTQAPSEPPSPVAAAAVQKLLEEAEHFMKNKKALEALQAADQALKVAQQEKDQVGEALAHRSRALALHQLDRTEEAVAAWLNMGSAWQRAGGGPGQLEGLASAGILLATSKPEEAETLFAQALALGQAETRRPLAAAQALHSAGTAMYYRAPLKHSRAFLTAALAIREKLIPDSLEVGHSLNDLGRVAIRQGDLDEAEAYFKRALAISEKLAPGSLEVASSLLGLGVVEKTRGHFAAALDDYQRALALTEKHLPNSLDVAMTLNNMGNAFAEMGNLDAAREFNLRALALREKLAPDSLDVAASLNNLGNLSDIQGDLTGARGYYQRSVAIQEKLNPNMIHMAYPIMNLGNVAAKEGDFAAARQYYRQALGIFEKQTPGSLGMAGILQNLAQLALDQGDLNAAEEYRQRALPIFEKVAPDSIYIATSLHQLGLIVMRRSNFAAAREYFQRSLAFAEKHAPNSSQVATALESLGSLATQQGELAAAEDYLQRALAINEKIARESPGVADSLHYLGELARRRGDLAAGRGFFSRELAILEKALGSDSVGAARSLLALAKLVPEVDETTALDAALRAEQIGREHLRLTARSLAEREALLYAATRPAGLDTALTLAAARSDRASPRVRKVFDALIRSRALVLDEMMVRHRVVTGDDPEVARLASQLVAARERLARLAVRGPRDDPPERYRKLFDRARKEKEEAERALAEKSLAFRQEQARNRLGLEDVAAVLPVDAVLVAFARYTRDESAGTGATRSPTATAPSYLAFILGSGESEPAVVPLGTAKEIEALVSALREQVAQEALASGRASKQSEAAYRRLAAELRRKVWDPIAGYLAGAQRVFIVPDGALHLVNLAALPVGQTKYLIERSPLIHYLSTERDLVPMERQGKGEGLLALGVPAFDETRLFAALMPQPMRPERAQPVQLATIKTFRGQRSTCGDFQSMRFEPLPASAREAEEITNLWKKVSSPTGRETAQLRGALVRESGSVVHLTGAQANEAEVKQQAPGKRVLHLATHGFFLGGRCTSALESSVKVKEAEIPATITGENPLLLAGLALAGANHRDAAGPEEEDGILTAEEIAALDLSGVEWAVLSACDTGVGEVKAGEGVLGLRRAFQVAGVRTLIMSLWPVEDKPVRAWMTALYRNRLVRAQSTIEAVHQANLSILRQRRAAGQSTHPFYWAGIVAAGDWH